MNLHRRSTYTSSIPFSSDILIQKSHYLFKTLSHDLPLSLPHRPFPGQTQQLPLIRLPHHLPVRKGKGRHNLPHPHPHPQKHLPQLRRRLAAPVSAIADNHGRLARPFVEEVIDGILDRGGVSPIVLGRDEDESGMFLDLEAPGAGVGVGVLGMVGGLRGDAGFVEEGEVPTRQVDEMEVGRRGDEGIVVVGLDGFDYEGSDLGAGAWLAGGAENDTYGWG